MLQRVWRALVRRYGVWLVVQAALGLGLAALATGLVLEITLAVRIDGRPAAVPSGEELVPTDSLLEGFQAGESAANRLSAAMRTGLFKSAASLGDKPMADKTIERIRSQLRLQCIMQLDGEPVAYVHVENNGLKKCHVGQSVEDLFTVTAIGDKSIEITIIEHPVTLSL